MPVHTDDELVSEVMRESAVERGEIEEIGGNSETEEEELELGVKEMLASIIRLRRALLSRGDVCLHCPDASPGAR